VTATATPVQPRPIAGFVGFASGALALLVVLAHFWIGPIAPHRHATVTIGEIAAEIRHAAANKLAGKPNPAPVATPWDSDRVLKLAASLLAGIGLIAGIAGLVRREEWRPAAAGMVLSGGAIVFELAVWSIVAVLGCLILIAVINNVSDILGN